MCKNSVKWLYRLNKNYAWESGFDILEDRVFFDSSGIVRLILEKGGRITVSHGYTWNGCSPKFCMFDLLIGTPEGVVDARTGYPKTYHASLVHDALYQFLKDDLPLNREQADKAFFKLMSDTGFFFRWIYWLAVRATGWLVWKAKSEKRHWHGQGISVDSLMLIAK